MVGRALNLQNFLILQLNIFLIKKGVENSLPTLPFVGLFVSNSDHLVVKTTDSVFQQQVIEFSGLYSSIRPSPFNTRGGGGGGGGLLGKV